MALIITDKTIIIVNWMFLSRKLSLRPYVYVLWTVPPTNLHLVGVKPWLIMFDIFIIIFKLPSLCLPSFLPSFRPFFVKYNSPFQKKGPQPLKSGLLRGNHFQQTLIGEFTKLTQLLSTSFIAKNVDCRLSCQTRYYYYFSGRLREKNILV